MACHLYNTERCLQLQLFKRPNFGVHFKNRPLIITQAAAIPSFGHTSPIPWRHLYGQYFHLSGTTFRGRYFFRAAKVQKQRRISK